jgi:EAL domain-containing protein (putative c-di-GMP-specific phosphodiesterase class I)
LSPRAGRHPGLLKVAKGIDTMEQQAHVAALGCDVAQGCVLSGPVQADVPLELITGRSRAEPALQLTPPDRG